MKEFNNKVGEHSDCYEKLGTLITINPGPVKGVTQAVRISKFEKRFMGDYTFTQTYLTPKEAKSLFEGLKEYFDETSL